MPLLSITDGAASFDVTILEAASPSRVVLFAVGGGGDPECHLPLLQALAARGSTVVAPHFNRFVSPVATDEVLLLRARRLRIALDVVARSGLPVAGVGHSIGCAMLLGLAGAAVWTRPDRPLAIAPAPHLERLALLAPAASFFQAPGALDRVGTPLLVWVGTGDTVTPPAQAKYLESTIGARVPVELRVTEGAGHFSFMDVPPPHATEPLPDRGAFLAEVSVAVCAFVGR
jgi:pimeloyl-ACP methyl ester carboxylesterase